MGGYNEEPEAAAELTGGGEEEEGGEGEGVRDTIPSPRGEGLRGGRGGGREPGGGEGGGGGEVFAESIRLAPASERTILQPSSTRRFWGLRPRWVIPEGRGGGEEGGEMDWREREG